MSPWQPVFFTGQSSGVFLDHFRYFCLDGRQVDDIARAVSIEASKASVIGYQTTKQAAKRIRENLAEKGYKGKRPNTILRLTEEGRESFRQYVQTVRGLFGNLPV